MTYDCINCAVGSLLTLFKKGLVAEEKQEIAMRALLNHLSSADLKQSPPNLGRDMHRIIRDVLEDPDPYDRIKKESNETLLKYYPQFAEEVRSDPDPFQLALRMAIAGNIIDFGPNHTFDWRETMERARSIDLSIDHSVQLKQDLHNAGMVLYIGDNAGEIVMDKLLLETIDHSNVYFGVRGSPIINDITAEDARAIGINDIATVISNGDNTPGTLLGNVSEEFRRIFNSADLIISKWQGNFEGLVGCGAPVYYLLIAKCEHVANFLNARVGDFILAGEKHAFSVA